MMMSSVSAIIQSNK